MHDYQPKHDDPNRDYDPDWHQNCIHCFANAERYANYIPRHANYGPTIRINGAPITVVNCTFTTGSNRYYDRPLPATGTNSRP